VALLKLRRRAWAPIHRMLALRHGTPEQRV